MKEYHPYGTTAWWTDPGSTVSQKRYRYTGKEKDEESGLYYHGARYYASWLGRWVSADPAGTVDGPNRFQYTRGNPIRWRDPNGRQTDDQEPSRVVIGFASEDPDESLYTMDALGSFYRAQDAVKAIDAFKELKEVDFGGDVGDIVIGFGGDVRDIKPSEVREEFRRVKDDLGLSRQDRKTIMQSYRARHKSGGAVAWVSAKRFYFFQDIVGRGLSTDVHESMHGLSTLGPFNQGMLSEGGAEFYARQAVRAIGEDFDCKQVVRRVARRLRCHFA